MTVPTIRLFSVIIVVLLGVLVIGRFGGSLGERFWIVLVSLGQFWVLILVGSGRRVWRRARADHFFTFID